VSDEWLSPLELKIGPDEFRRLPRNPAYRYTWFAGSAWLNPRPRYYHALLDLPSLPEETGRLTPAARQPAIRPFRPGDWEALVPVFADAFREQVPFGVLDEGRRLLAAHKSLTQTRTGGDGPWVEPASFVAEAGATPVGAVLVTLLPATDPTDWASYHWEEPPPPDCVARRLGRPHLTWIFVTPDETGRGLGTALLHAAGCALRALGYAEMVSTFLLGNDSSMLWHWRAGFRLLAHPASRRK
jgi:GNAT superfamily N-acetyltransferase